MTELEWLEKANYPLELADEYYDIFANADWTGVATKKVNLWTEWWSGAAVLGTIVVPESYPYSLVIRNIK